MNFQSVNSGMHISIVIPSMIFFLPETLHNTTPALEPVANIFGRCLGSGTIRECRPRRLWCGGPRPSGHAHAPAVCPAASHAGRAARVLRGARGPLGAAAGAPARAGHARSGRRGGCAARASARVPDGVPVTHFKGWMR